MELASKTQTQYINYTSLKEEGAKSGYNKNNFIMFVKELNILKYKTSVSLNYCNNNELPDKGSKINLTVEYLNFIDIFFENSINSVMLVGSNGRIQYVNPRFEKITGYTSKEIKGQNLNILKCWDSQTNEHDLFWHTLNAGKEWRGELKKKKKNGDVFWEYSTIYPVFDENQSITHYLIINEDITEIKKAESRVNHFSQNSAEKYILRVKFLARISHEIKVNLNIISDFVEIMKHLIKDYDYEYCNIYFDAVNKHFDQLFKGVEDFSKEDPSQFNLLQPNNIFKFLKEVQSPIKIILRLMDLIKDEAGRNNDTFLFAIFNVVRDLSERVLKITQLINDLSKGEIDEKKYLTRVLKEISEEDKS